MDRFDVCIAGAGVVGLALAYQLLRTFPKASVLLVEQEPSFGQHTSSRLSEVIHAGIYYPPGSLKAKLCIEGKAALYEFCDRFQVPYRKVGKLIISQSDSDQALVSLGRNARLNGINDLEYWPEDLIKSAEPAVRAKHALFSPSTGIVDSHQYMTALLHLSEQRGLVYAPRTKVTSVHPLEQGFILDMIINNGRNTELYAPKAKWFINCAGLWSHQLAKTIENLPASCIPRRFLCKGDYFDYRGENPFRRLIYPLPDPEMAGLGIHSTQDLAGRLKFGPDAEYVDEIDYRVASNKRDMFAKAIRSYFPALKADKLSPAYSGVRPKISGPSEKPGDFLITGPEESGISGLIQLFGIESPGLTASLSIGVHIAHLINQRSI
ncbi:MAG: FAD-dependent oxidoreductase [Gammaproteobacteria bacterium]|nr:FAD-dependent oxidoreductase [Gammaproteobacteria bacterium]HBW84863.1 NAD(P)/FAD-dependent oxidoreductase [Gammaproteobacteria bacterium]